MILVKYLGVLLEIAGTEKEDMEFTGKVSKLVSILSKKYNGFSKHLSDYTILVNGIDKQDNAIKNNDTVIFVPIVTGG